MYTSAQELAMELLKLTPEKYAEIIYCKGIEQIASLLEGVTYFTDIEDSPAFWNDYKNRWAVNEQKWIDSISVAAFEFHMNYRHCTPEMWDSWMSFHKCDVLESFPIGVQRIVLEQRLKELKFKRA